MDEPPSDPRQREADEPSSSRAPWPPPSNHIPRAEATSPWWRHPLPIAGAVVVWIAVIAAVVAIVGDDPATSSTATSSTDRERAIAAYESQWQMSREEVLEMAGNFCNLVDRSEAIADFEEVVVGDFADEGLSFMAADAIESMVRIGQCEQAYFDIGGKFGECVTVADCDPDPEPDRPSTPLPEIGDGGPAIVRLENGDVFEFDATCSLTYEELPGLSIRYGVFADDGTLRLEAVAYPIAEDEPGEDPGEWYLISVFDSSTYAELWSASTLFGDLEFRVDGSTVSAEGQFFPDGVPGEDGVDGEFVAEC